MLKIDQRCYEQLRRHGEETYPHECCGVMLGTMEGDERVVTAVVRAGNTRTDSPQNRYNIDPRELIAIQRQGREKGLDIVGFYHSHPDHPAHWSATDLEDAHWLGCSYVITRVEKGQARDTNSFALAGGEESAKRFQDEQLEVTGQIAETKTGA
ncbi:MAG TPA: M67 family metallopeptidase [Terriglobales bacterium]|nr:M67 family metallopeptidase [Terriglobales bacterium]